jgi:hypothetical protein
VVPSAWWADSAFDHGKFHELIQKAVAKVFAEVYKTKILCRMAPYEKWVYQILGQCQGGLSGTGTMSYSVATKTAFCNDLASVTPIKSYDGFIDIGSGTCGDAAAISKEVSLNKVVIIDTETPTSTRRASACAVFEVIKNEAGAVVGQRIGDGVSVQGISSVGLCVNPSVGASQRCSAYTVYDFVTVSSAGVYSSPLGKTVTTNAQGQLCFSGASSDKNYVPVLVAADWASKTTPAPTTAATPAPSTGGSSSTPTPKVDAPKEGEAPVEVPQGNSEVTVGTKTVKLEAGAGVKLGIAKDESGVSQVQLSLAGGSKVSIPESLMDANQEVKVESKSAAAVTAASAPPAGTTSASDGISISLKPAIEVKLAFVVAGMTSSRRQSVIYHTFWLDKISNEWKPMCTEHKRDAAAKSVTAPVSKDVQGQPGFNPTIGCNTAVTCDGKGGTIMVFALTSEPDCSGGGLSGGAIAGIVIGECGWHLFASACIVYACFVFMTCANAYTYQRTYIHTYIIHT